jgi:hypothetical protein
MIAKIVMKIEITVEVSNETAGEIKNYHEEIKEIAEDMYINCYNVLDDGTEVEHESEVTLVEYVVENETYEF